MVQISDYPARRAVSSRECSHSDSEASDRAGVHSLTTAAAVQIDQMAIDDIVCGATSRHCNCKECIRQEKIRALKLAGQFICLDQGS